MPTLTTPRTFNYYCTTCRDWRGIGSMNYAGRCLECDTRCEWTRYELGQMIVADPGDHGDPGKAVEAVNASPKENGTA